MTPCTEQDGVLERRTAQEFLVVEPWGPHAVRVRARAAQGLDDPALPGALDGPPPGAAPTVSVHPDGTARIVNGRLTVEAGADGRLRFLHTATGRELLAEKHPYTWYPSARVHAPLGEGRYRLAQSFEAYPGERLHGLGQHLHGRLDQKGLVVDLVQGNTVAAIPFLHSSRGYGLLWNNPAVGRVELGADATRWVADEARRIDYWITAGDTPAEIMACYADATGHPPLIPDWASGFWQSKLRYRTQDELLAVAREYKERRLPLSVIVCDFFHWTRMGDWDFDPTDWPDPGAMVEELGALGVRLAVSVWPTVEPTSTNYQALHDAGHLVADSRGGVLTFPWPHPRARGRPPADRLPRPVRPRRPPTPLGATARALPRARRHRLLAGRLRTRPAPGAAWPARSTAPASGAEVGNLYGVWQARAVAEGLREAGDERPFSLTRSAWKPAASGTAPRSGRVTSHPPSRRWPSRSRPGSTSRCPVSLGGTPTSAASRAATRPTRTTRNCWSAGSSTGPSARSCACTATGHPTRRSRRRSPAAPTRSGPTASRRIRSSANTSGCAKGCAPTCTSSRSRRTARAPR